MLAHKLSVQIIIPLILDSSLDLGSNSRADNLENAAKHLKQLNILDHAEPQLIDSSDLGFSDYIANLKDDKFLKVKNEKYSFYLSANDIDLVFSSSEKLIYFDYNVLFVEIVLKLNNYPVFPISIANLESLHGALVALKDNNKFNILNTISCKDSSKDSLKKLVIGEFFSISFFIESSSNDFNDPNTFSEMYAISTALCGEHCSAKTVGDFVKSPPLREIGLGINHGFTGSFFFFQCNDMDDKLVRKILGMNSYLQFMTNIIPILSFEINKIIKKYKSIKKTDINQLKYEFNELIYLRDTAESLLFDAYPQNVSTTKLDTLIYENGFENWQFEKYVIILKDQIKRLNIIISEINETLIRKQTKIASFALKFISIFAATSVLADILTYINLDIGYFFLIIPILITIISFFMFFLKRI